MRCRVVAAGLIAALGFAAPSLAGGLDDGMVARVPGSDGDPSVIRLADRPSLVSGPLVATSGSIVYRSFSRGKFWQPIGAIPGPAAGMTRCCGTLFAMPETIGHGDGALWAGTLVFAATEATARTPRIALYASRDEGETWRPIALPAKDGPASDGLSDPELSFTKIDAGDGRGPRGALVLYAGDESQPAGHAQMVSETATFDAVTWTARRPVVASAAAADRAGRPRATVLPDGHTFLAYELCSASTGDRCVARYEISRDGWAFDAANLGAPIETADGRYLAGAPALAWMPLHAAAHGAIVVAGRAIPERLGAPHRSAAPDAASGRALFVTIEPEAIDPSGRWTAPWSTIAAPLAIPALAAGTPQGDDRCADEPASLLGADDGESILELASESTRTAGVDQCPVYAGRAAWNDGK